MPALFNILTGKVSHIKSFVGDADLRYLLPQARLNISLNAAIGSSNNGKIFMELTLDISGSPVLSSDVLIESNSYRLLESGDKLILG